MTFNKHFLNQTTFLSYFTAKKLLLENKSQKFLKIHLFLFDLHFKDRTGFVIQQKRKNDFAARSVDLVFKMVANFPI